MYRYKWGKNSGMKPSECDTNYILNVYREAKACVEASERELKARNVDLEGAERPIRIWQSDDRYDN